MKSAISAIVILMLAQGVLAENNTVYKISIDQDYGFYRVIDMSYKENVQYDNNTLTINQGDEVIWFNDATPDEPLTIVSEQGLWDNKSAYLRWNYQKFNYTFNDPGNYTFYIKEYPRERQNIVVIGKTTPTTPVVTVDNILTPTTPVVTVDYIPTPNSTEKEESITKTTSNNNLIIIVMIMIIIPSIMRGRK